MSEARMALLSIDNLTTGFRTDQGVVRAVERISFEVPERTTVGVVGESGCGKSVTALSIMRLVPSPPGFIESGAIRFRGRDLLTLTEREMCDLRGNDIAMIFQEPMTSLNPVYNAGSQIAEAIRIHKKAPGRKAAWDRAVEMLRLVGMPSPEENAKAYPHELSGGQRQRVMIAMALACEPKLLIADEPTTALDVTIQAQILELLDSQQKRLGMSVLLITHDLGLVAEHAEFMIVMYAGQIVEEGPVDEVLSKPRHPYTRGLLASLPGRGGAAPRTRLPTIEGIVPDLRSPPSGCRFADRCSMMLQSCTTSDPPLVKIADRRNSRCLRWAEMSP